VTDFLRAFVLGWVLAACSLGCDERRRVPASDEAVAALAKSPQPAGIAQRVAYRRFEVTERLAAELPRPEHFHERACPDAALDAGAATVVLASEDVRYEPKHLLPLDMLEQLLGADRRFAAHARRFGDTTPASLSDEEAESELAELEQMAKRRYKAIYYITDYASPKLIRKKNRVRSEWLPGVVASWLVVHDLKDGRALCQAQLIVRNDVTDEPISRRMKATVRQRLIAELAGALRSEGQLALGRISKTLKFP
jgi:hypothetical protein